MSHSHDRQDGGNLGAAFLLNLAFTLLEIGGGIWTNSVAILADAVHDSADCISLGIAWFLQKFSRKQSNDRFTYGYRRFSVLGALISGIVLLAGLSFVLWQAVPRLLEPEKVHAPGMMALAVVGVLMNGAAFLKLRGGKSLNETVVSWHLLEDALGWIAVLVGGAVMYFADYPIIDPLLSVCISSYVLWRVLGNLKQVLQVFLQRSPSSFDVQEFEARLRDWPTVVALHHTHVWTIDGEHHVLTSHVVMRSGSSREDVLQLKQRVRELIESQPIEHLTVDVEMEDEPCLSEIHSSSEPA